MLAKLRPIEIDRGVSALRKRPKAPKLQQGSAMKYWSVSTTNASSEYSVSCIIFALLWPLFFRLFVAYFRLFRVTHLDHIKVGV